MISKQTIDEITSRISLLDVVGEFVKLRKRGTSYLGLCPFHNEKTPSFTVSPAKEVYKCFGCGKSGNAITFLMEHEKYSYVEALRWLANRYNIEIEETFQKDEDRIRLQEADSLYIINKFAVGFFQEQLRNTEEGQSIAMSYLYERGFSDETINTFQIGYCPAGGNPFSKVAIQQQFSRELLLKTGLVVERGADLLDNYRGRIIFPIHQVSGKVAGFGARIIGKSDKAPKYINTPENEIYVKSKILYGAYFSRHFIDKQEECLLVEGYTDVTSLHQCGIKNVVASGGTSLTVDQLRLINKYAANLTIVYDGDSAGIKAAMRGLDMALEEGLNVRLVLLPDNEDPDSFAKKNGSDYVRAYIQENRKDFILFQIDALLKEAASDVTKKNEAVQQVAETISRINQPEDFAKRSEYIRQSARLLGVDENGLLTLINKIAGDRVVKENKWQKPERPGIDNLPEKAVSEDLLIDPVLLQERALLRILLEHGNKEWQTGLLIAHFIASQIDGFPLSDEDMQYLWGQYFTKLNKGEKPAIRTMLYDEDERIRKNVVLVSGVTHELSPRWDEVLENIKVNDVDNTHQDVLLTIVYYKLKKLKMMLLQNQEDMKMTNDAERHQEMLMIHNELKKMEIALTKDLGTVILN
jgi:DNA primase